ncbi:MAG TPA: hemolysin III family protein [Tepidisphaeraceae bacterium]|jgi:hemolysin III
MTDACRPTSGLSRWIKDPYCGLSHAGGAVASLIGVVVLLVLTRGGPMLYVGLVVYGISLVLLFTASALAHSLHVGERLGDRLDRFDHAAIFLLIAGTYTPVCLTALRGPWGYTMLSIEGALAVIGVVTVLFTRVPLTWVSPLYVPMAWLVTIAFVPMVRSMTTATLLWLVVGGVIYSVGAVVYITKRPRLWPGRFGYHDLWHTMVLAGAACHFVAVATLVL